jgi:serine O-acetyltransferase
MWHAVKADAARFLDYAGGARSPVRIAQYLRTEAAWALLELRFYQWLGSDCPPPLRPFLKPLSFGFQLFVETATGISIEHGAEVGRGLYIDHFGGIVIGGGVRIGERCDISQGVTIGVGGRGEERGSPAIGDDVYIGPGAKVFGRITIGDGARIGANAVVSKDVPAGAVARAPHAEVIIET